MELMEQIGSWIGYGLAAVFAALVVYQDMQCRRKGTLSTRQNQQRYQYTIEIWIAGNMEQIQFFSDWSYENLEEILSRYRKKDKWGSWLSFPSAKNEYRCFLESAVEQIHIRKTDTKEGSVL